MQSTRHAGEDL